MKKKRKMMKRKTAVKKTDDLEPNTPRITQRKVEIQKEFFMGAFEFHVRVPFVLSKARRLKSNLSTTVFAKWKSQKNAVDQIILLFLKKTSTMAVLIPIITRTAIII